MNCGRGLLYLGLMTIGCLHALPTDPVVRFGEMEIECSAPSGAADLSHMIIHASDGAATDWSSFSIEHGESVRVIQPDGGLFVSRVMNGTPSMIDGRFESNGLCVLINPDGIMISKHGYIKADGGFIGTTLDLALEALIEQRTCVPQGDLSGKIVNCGRIESVHGPLLLQARYVVNKGEIVSRQGAALALQERPHIYIDLDQEHPDQVEHHLKRGGNPYTYATGDTQHEDALTFESIENRIMLRASEEISLQGAIEGELRCEGKRILCHAGSSVIGQQLIQFVSDELSVIEEGSSVVCRGRVDGGQVFLLSRGEAIFNGKVDVRAPAFGNRGGLFELSGWKGVEMEGELLRGREGTISGLLIIDPEAQVTISQLPSYHHHFTEGQVHSDASVVNINVDRLIDELSKGPVMVRTQCVEETPFPGGIELCADVRRRYNSPYPLLLYSEGKSGIQIDGQLENIGSGRVSGHSPNGPIVVGEEGGLRARELICNTGSDVICLNRAFLVGRERLTIDAGRDLSLVGGKLVVDTGCLEVQVDGSIVLEDTPSNDALILLHEGKRLALRANEQLRLCSCHERTVSIESRASEAELIVDGYLEEIMLFSASGKSSLVSLGKTKIDPYVADVRLIARGGEVELIGHDSFHLSTLGELFLFSDEKLPTSRVQLSFGHEVNLQAETGITCVAPHLRAEGDLELHTQGNLFASHSDLRAQSIKISAGDQFHLHSSDFICGPHSLFTIQGLKGGQIGGNSHLRAGSLDLSSAQGTISLKGHPLLEAVEGPLILSCSNLIQMEDYVLCRAEQDNFYLSVSNGNLILGGESCLAAEAGGGKIVVGRSLILEQSSRIEALGGDGLEIRVDQLNRESHGGVIVGPHAHLISCTRPIHLFTRARRFNTIQGRLNNCHLIASPRFLNTSEEFWGEGGELLEADRDPQIIPFTIFYAQEGLFSGVDSTSYTQNLNLDLGVVTSELFRELNPYNAYTRDALMFNIYPEIPFASLRGEQFLLRRKYYRQRQIPLPHRSDAI